MLGMSDWRCSNRLRLSLSWSRVSGGTLSLGVWQVNVKRSDKTQGPKYKLKALR